MMKYNNLNATSTKCWIHSLLSHDVSHSAVLSKVFGWNVGSKFLISR